MPHSGAYVRGWDVLRSSMAIRVKLSQELRDALIEPWRGWWEKGLMGIGAGTALVVFAYLMSLAATWLGL